MGLLAEKMLKKRIQQLEDLLDAEMLANERLAEEVAELKCKYDAERLARAPRLWDELKEENKKLKEEKFDNMEELAKRDGMCLVDIHIFDKLIAQEEENKELKEQLDARHRHKDPRITVRSCDDRAEYNRQVMYLKSNPDCERIPPRKWSRKSKKNQPLQSS